MAKHGGAQLTPEEQVEVSKHMGRVISDCVCPSCGLSREIRGLAVSIEVPKLSYFLSNRRGVRVTAKRFLKAGMDIRPDILQRRRGFTTQGAPAGTSD